VPGSSWTRRKSVRSRGDRAGATRVALAADVYSVGLNDPSRRPKIEVVAGRLDGLRVVFDPDIDRGAWAGPVGDVTATAGEAWLGPMGLLGRLELELGLGGAWPSPAVRTCHLASILASPGGGEEWWRASFEVDPMGACTQLLRDRDTLVKAA